MFFIFHHNKINQIRPGYKELMMYIERNNKNYITQDDIQNEINTTDMYGNNAYMFNMEIESILIEKTEGDARGKVMSSEGDGINAYRMLHTWFTQVSQLGLQQRFSNRHGVLQHHRLSALVLTNLWS